MLGRILNLLFFGLVAFLLWHLNSLYPSVSLEKWFVVSVALCISYFVFKFLLEELLGKNITDDKLKYQFKKTVSVLFWFAFLVVFVRIWIPNPQALLVAYGLIGAGVAVALQDLFRNFAGGILIFVNGIYHVGDRVEVDGEFGDVIDIGLLYTTVLELREWVNGDQSTGRICSVPNGVVLSKVVNNYSRDFSFIWDEIVVPVTYDSDWRSAKDGFLKVVRELTGEFSKVAENELSRLKGRFFVSKRDVFPNVFVSLTDNWVELTVRYIVPVRERRVIHSRLSELLLAEVEKSKKVSVASETLRLVK